MSSRQLTVWIKGREAIPARAIPFFTGSTLSPEGVASVLAHDSLPFPSADGKPVALTAYRYYGDDRYSPVLPREWQQIVGDLLSLSIGLSAELCDETLQMTVPSPKLDAALIPDIPDEHTDWNSISPEEIERRMEVFDLAPCDGIENVHNEAAQLSRPEWKWESIRMLPAGCFVWRDEFEQAWSDVYGRVLILDEKPGYRELNYDPLVPEGLHGLVLAGFGAGSPAAVQSPPTISLNEYSRERRLLEFGNSLQHWETSRQQCDVHGADVLASAALRLKQVMSDDALSPSQKVTKLHEWLKARADERRLILNQQNEADVLDRLRLAFEEQVMARAPIDDGDALLTSR